MGATFNQGQAQQARYWYERIPFTAGPVALAAGLNPVFSASQWNAGPSPDWQAELIGLQLTQNAGVQAQMLYDDRAAGQTATQGFADSAPAGVRRLPVSAPAVRQLQLALLNNTGAPVAGFQCTYEIAMTRLSAAQKLQAGYTLSAHDEEILHLLDSANGSGRQQVADLVDRGTVPIAMERQLQAILDNRRLGDHPGSGLYHVTASATSAGMPFATLTAGQNEFLVLQELAVEGAAAITLKVDRDEDLNYVQVSGAAFVQADDAPWTTFVPALRALNFRAAAAAPQNNVTVRLRVVRYRISNLWRVRMGIARNTAAVPGDTYAKVWAGLA